MKTYSIGKLESEFADIIWAEEPIESGVLVEKALVKLNWKKSTTYTVLKRLCDKGIFKNERGIVRSQISREQFYSYKSLQTVVDNYHGSLPAFVAAFVHSKSLNKDEVDEIQKIIDEYREDNK